MNLLSEIISKPILNLYTGKIEGTVKNVCFDDTYKKIKWLKMFDDDEEEEYFVDAKKIFCIGDNLILIRNSEALTMVATLNQTERENNPINLDIYSLSGNFVGKLVDVEINDKNETENFVADTAKISHKKIINIGESIIINDSNKKVSATNFRPKMKINSYKTSDNVISILPRIEQPAENPQNIEKAEKKAFIINEQPLPSKITGNGNFLIGRKVVKTIYGLNNEIIIKKDNIINPKNLESAKKHSKLVELAVYSQIKA